VGRALKGRSDRPYVFTKCGLLGNRETDHVENTLEPDSIRREVEDSLRRLGVDVIDLYQIHWPDPDPAIEDAWATLIELKEQGKVRHIGVSNFDAGQLERIAGIHPVGSLQPHYSLLHREVEMDVLPWCADHGTGVIAYSPMESGLLTGAMTRERIESLPDDDWRRNNEDYQEPALTANLQLVERLSAVAERHGCTPGAVAIAWVLGHPAVTGAIVGARRPDQIEGTVVGGSLQLSLDDLREIGVPPRAHESYLPVTV
ncbi:MAG: Aldo/keto reductase, partial [uncultured Thermoleophilia bacterium]